MRYTEIHNGMRVPVFADEMIVIEKIVQSDKKRALANDLDEYERELASKMVSRGVLNRIVDENVVYFEMNDTTRIWRF